MLASTPGEFYALMHGCAARERNRNWMLAVVACSMGGGDPWRLIGEERPATDPDHADGWGGSDSAVARARALEARDKVEREARERDHSAWVPEALRSILGDDA